MGVGVRLHYWCGGAEWNLNLRNLPRMRTTTLPRIKTWTVSGITGSPTQKPTAAGVVIWAVVMSPAETVPEPITCGPVPGSRQFPPYSWVPVSQRSDTSSAISTRWTAQLYSIITWFYRICQSEASCGGCLRGFVSPRLYLSIPATSFGEQL